MTQVPTAGEYALLWWAEQSLIDQMIQMHRDSRGAYEDSKAEYAEGEGLFDDRIADFCRDYVNWCPGYGGASDHQYAAE